MSQNVVYIRHNVASGTPPECLRHCVGTPTTKAYLLTLINVICNAGCHCSHEALLFNAQQGFIEVALFHLHNNYFFYLR